MSTFLVFPRGVCCVATHIFHYWTWTHGYRGKSYHNAKIHNLKPSVNSTFVMASDSLIVDPCAIQYTIQLYHAAVTYGCTMHLWSFLHYYLLNLCGLRYKFNHHKCSRRFSISYNRSCAWDVQKKRYRNMHTVALHVCMVAWQDSRTPSCTMIYVKYGNQYLICSETDMLRNLYALELVCPGTDMLRNLYALELVCPGTDMLWNWCAQELVCRGTDMLGNWYARELVCPGTGMPGNWYAQEPVCSGTGMLGNWYTRKLICPGTGMLRSWYDRELVYSGTSMSCILEQNMY